MLSSLLQSMESAFGTWLSPASDIVFLAGLALLAYVIVAPVIRVVVDIQSARIGMEREWVMHCLSCRRMTIVAGAKCTNCGEKLGIPWPVRIRQFFSRAGEPHWLRLIRWIYTAIGVLFFIIVTIATVKSLDAWSPQSSIEKFFLGLSMVTWSGLGWLIGRVIGIGTGGPLTRVRDAIFSLALASVLLTTVTLAVAARPVEEVIAVRAHVNGQLAQVGSQATALIGHQIGFEYLLVEHTLAGYHEVFPLALIGARRLDLPQSHRRAQVSSFLWSNADTLSARGLSVRKRTDQFVVTRPGVYEFVIRDGAIVLRQFDFPS